MSLGVVKKREKIKRIKRIKRNPVIHQTRVEEGTVEAVAVVPKNFSVD
jgi:hypothetical protein